MTNKINHNVTSRSNPMRIVVNCLLALSLLVSATTVAAQSIERTTYYHNTLQGTPVAATNESGEIKWSQTYSSYGFHNGNSQEVEESSIVFGTAGHVEDQFEDRLLVYQKARYYDPALGRFLSIDPVGFQATNPQSFNRYAYVNNNPTTYVDPDGRFPFLIPVVIFLGKEIAAEIASRATNGATDFLSVRRLGTKAAKAAARGVKSLRKKRDNPCGCFDADTPVLTADGHKAISDVELGELLVARDEFTGEISLKPVTELLRYEDRQFYELELLDEQGISTLLDVTDDHPFWVENLGWVDSDDLQPGMLVMDLDGSWHGVNAMSPVEREGLAYNFEVGDFHTYFVGESDLWVHNCGDGPTAGGRGKNKLNPDPDAVGDHSVFQRGADGKIFKYETYEKTSSGHWNPVKRYDGGKPDGSPGAPHVNKKTGESIPTPHVQGKSIPGGARPAKQSEIPK